MSYAEDSMWDDFMLDDENICDCDLCQKHGWHGKLNDQPTYRYVMDSSLLSGTSRFGTMDLFSILREEYHPVTEEVVYAELVFRIPMHWVYNKFVEPRIKRLRGR